MGMRGKQMCQCGWLLNCPAALCITLKFASGREVNTCVISHVIKELNNHQLCKPHVRPAWRKLIVMGCCPTSRSTKRVPMLSCVKRSETCCLPRSTECKLKRQTQNCQRAKVPREQNKLPITQKFASGREINTCVISHVIKELNNHRFCKPHVRPAWRKLNVMGCCPTSRSTKFVPMSSCGKRSTTCCLPLSTECALKRQTKNCQRAKVPREQNKLPITAKFMTAAVFGARHCRTWQS